MKEINLTKGYVAIVDDEDYERVNQFQWTVTITPSGSAYSFRTDYSSGGKKTIYMHRFVANTPDDLTCDHINHNTLDNRKENLRNCSHQDNMLNRKISPSNTSGFKGVSRYNGKWYAKVSKGKKIVFRKSFPTKIEAAHAYDKVAKEVFGEFANLNFI